MYFVVRSILAAATECEKRNEREEKNFCSKTSSPITGIVRYLGARAWHIHGSNVQCSRTWMMASDSPAGQFIQSITSTARLICCIAGPLSHHPSSHRWGCHHQPLECPPHPMANRPDPVESRLSMSAPRLPLVDTRLPLLKRHSNLLIVRRALEVPHRLPHVGGHRPLASGPDPPIENHLTIPDGPRLAIGSGGRGHHHLFECPLPTSLPSCRYPLVGSSTTHTAPEITTQESHQAPQCV